MFGNQTLERPSYVPDHLVYDYPNKLGLTANENPFDGMIQAIHAERPPIFYSMDAYPGGSPAWVVRRAEDLRTIYFDTVNFSNKDFAPFAKLIGENWSEVPAEVDPPMHALFRSWINPVFTPNAMAVLDTKIRTYAREYIDAFKARGQCEFMSEFAFEFPIKVILELMGLPLDMAPTFMAWEMDLLHNNDLGAIAAASRKVVDYLRGEIEDRKRNPGDDLFSFGVKSQIQGRPLTDDELLGFAFNLFIGGLDTVSTNMAWQFHHLATHPEDQRLLRSNPERINDAVEEYMRAYAAVTTFRTAVNPIEINGVTFQPGDKIAMCTSLAARDPEEYDRPNEVIIGRKVRYLSFGYGPHLCLGMHLARREMRIAMVEFLSRVPEFRIADDAAMEYHLGPILQPVRLPLAWEEAIGNRRRLLAESGS